MLNITKGGYKLFNAVDLISQFFKRYDWILLQNLKLSFLWKRRGEIRIVGQKIPS